MPDYQTAEGMAAEPYERKLRSIRRKLKRIIKLCNTSHDANGDNWSLNPEKQLAKIQRLAERALKR